MTKDEYRILQAERYLQMFALKGHMVVYKDAEGKPRPETIAEMKVRHQAMINEALHLANAWADQMTILEGKKPWEREL